MNKYLYINFDLILKMLVIFIIMTICSLFIVIKSKEAFSSEIKTLSIVSSDVFKLSDIFISTDYEEDTVLGISPEPGEKITLNARTLYRIASRYSIDWKPTSIADRVTIKRNATVIDHKTIKAGLEEAAKIEIGNNKIKLIISGTTPTINLDPKLPPTIEVIDISINKSGWFEASIAAPSALNPVKTAKIFGQIKRLISIPTIITSLKAGDVIGKTDIEWIDVDIKQINANIIIKESEIIGMTPRRYIASGSIIKESDLKTPQLVKRGEYITITYEIGALNLTASGKALQNGSYGDFIKVTNLSSNQTIEAMVTNTKRAKIIQ